LNGNNNKITDETKKKLQSFWRDKLYFIIDEFSMIGKSFLTSLSKNISIGKQSSESEQLGLSFGGINVILCGDLHQFPPIAQNPQQYLYRPSNMLSDSLDCQIGRSIYEEFTMVVILKEQIRVTDPVWRNFLTNLRKGHVQSNDLSMLCDLIISVKSAKHDKYDRDPWSNAALVTPRHAVRTIWNAAASRNWCRRNKHQLFVCTAEDTIGNKPLTLEERYLVAKRKKTDRRKHNKKELPMKIEIAKGMKVLVTTNVETDLDITNGA
jgi:hypothetical protein